jgi:hypothetical protein
MERSELQQALDNAESYYMWAHATSQPQRIMDAAQSRFESALNALHAELERLAA